MTGKTFSFEVPGISDVIGNDGKDTKMNPDQRGDHLDDASPGTLFSTTG
jgi:hypothetical protein